MARLRSPSSSITAARLSTAALVLVLAVSVAHAVRDLGRCGPKQGTPEVEASKLAGATGTAGLPAASEVPDCKRHRDEHSTEEMVGGYGGTKIVIPVWASKSDRPLSSSGLDVSESDKSSDADSSEFSGDSSSSAASSSAGTLCATSSTRDILLSTGFFPGPNFGVDECDFTGVNCTAGVVIGM